jgi:exoribonuclease R
MQELLDTGSRTPQPQTPAWASLEDIQKLHRIHRLAALRLRNRERSARNRFECNLPDPLIKVDIQGCKVLSVSDQILGTRDARIAVAEMMIAANEVCSRIAQTHKISLPYRGTRLPSSDHDAATSFLAPPGTITLSSRDESTTFFAEAIVNSLKYLSGITRAMYFHQPIPHQGLETTFYCHSTSPLRRYPDMLVHHQLKCYIARRKGLTIDAFIPEFQMATLCSDASAKQERSAILQDSSSRFWILSYIWYNLLKEGKNCATRELICLVGQTRDVSASPEVTRFAGGPCGSLRRYVSDVFIPEIQLVHFVQHDRADVRVGTTLHCLVRQVQPLIGLLELEVIAVDDKEDSSAEIIKAALIPALDS